jgi:hypothetical protein
VSQRSAAGVSVLCVAAVYAATLLWLPDGLWIVDNGNKLIQVEAILASGHRDYSIPWPGRELDPQLEFNPIPAPFSVIHGERLYAVYSPAFPALSSPFFALLGSPGLLVLPFVAGVALLAGLVCLTRAAGLPAAAAPASVLVAGLCTPVWFYSAVFWEHIVGASLAVWSVAAWLRFLESGSGRALLACGAACAVAVWFRDQLLMLGALMALLALARPAAGRVRTVLLLGAGLAAGLLPLALFQWLTLGDPLGFHLTHGFQFQGGAGDEPAARLAAHAGDRLLVLHHLFLAWAGDRAFSAVLSLPLVLLLLVCPSLPRRAFEWTVVALALWALAGALVTCAGVAGADSPIEWLLRSNGFWSAAPLLALGLVR